MFGGSRQHGTFAPCFARSTNFPPFGLSLVVMASLVPDVLIRVLDHVFPVPACQEFLGLKADRNVVTIRTHDRGSSSLQAPKREMIKIEKTTGIIAQRRSARHSGTEVRPAELGAFAPLVNRIAASVIEAAINEFHLELGPEEGQVAFVHAFPAGRFPTHGFAASRDKSAVVLMTAMQKAKVRVFPGSHERQFSGKTCRLPSWTTPKILSSTKGLCWYTTPALFSQSTAPFWRKPVYGS